MSATTHSRNAVNALLVQRVYGAFLEMPGLRLTCKQAQRLWGLDEQSCIQLLEFLVDPSSSVGRDTAPTRSVLRATQTIHGYASQTQTSVHITAADRERRDMCARFVHARGESGGPDAYVAYEVSLATRCSTD